MFTLADRENPQAAALQDALTNDAQNSAVDELLAASLQSDRWHHRLW
jgi:hypothetical protein